MSSEQELISWKTAAWKDPNMVAGYAQRMIDPSGAIMMKNRIEVSAFARYRRGQKILDVGIGTGRASLPLARAGYDVTGVDSSAAMLEKTKELAGDLPISLFEGDVANLAFRDDTFDTVMALNTIAHFPHWQPILEEWQRVLKPGGRMVFDMFSLDHDITYARVSGEDEQFGIDHFAPKDSASYYLRLKVADVVEHANRSGMRIVAIQPYSVLTGSGGYNRFLEDTPLSGKAWDRLLTWVGADQKLFDFLTFIEEEFFGKLTTAVACRYVVVMDNSAGISENQNWLHRNDVLNQELQRGISRTLMESAGIDVPTFSATLREHLGHAPNRYAFIRILSANLKWKLPIALDEIVSGQDLEECNAVLGRAKADAAVTKLLQEYHETPELKPALQHLGVPVANALEYGLMISILDGALGAFDTAISTPLNPVRK